jgi:hypothetical protein
MTRSLDLAARDAKVAELKRLITTGKYETLEKLEDAVDAFLWSEDDRREQQLEAQAYGQGLPAIVKAHPK